MSKKLLVAGATGHIGSKASQILLESGHQVTAMGRDADKLKTLADAGATKAVGDLADTAFLTAALSQVEAAFLLIPPHLTAEDNLAYQAAIGASLTKAIEDSGIKQIVFLSSQGADKLDKKIGPIRGVGEQELRLKALAEAHPALSITLLRPAYFMENNIGNLFQLRQNNGTVYHAFPPDYKTSFIGTQDIAKAVAETLAQPAKPGVHIIDLLGAEDLSMAEAVAIEGKALGYDNPQYIQVPSEAVGQAMQSMGMGASIVSLYLEMFEGLSQGIFSTPRTTENTTATKYNDFIKATVAHMGL